MNLDVDIQGSDDLAIRLQAIQGNLGDKIKAVMLKSAFVAYRHMRDNVPQSRQNRRWGDYKEGGEERLVDHLAITQVSYLPGGAGGGGSYEMEVGWPGGAPEHIQWVMGGTSDWWQPKAMTIRTGKRPGAIPFKAGGQGFFSHFRSGQQANDRWWLEARQLANRVIDAEFSRMDLTGSPFTSLARTPRTLFE